MYTGREQYVQEQDKNPHQKDTRTPFVPSVLFGQQCGSFPGWQVRRWTGMLLTGRQEHLELSWDYMQSKRCQQSQLAGADNGGHILVACDCCVGF